MTRYSKLPLKINQRLPLLFFLIIYLILSLNIYSDFGVAIDEPMEYGFSQMLYNRYFGHDPVLIRDFAHESPTSREIWSHNHFHGMLLYMLNDSGSLERYHLLNLLFALIAFWVSYEIMLTVSARPRQAIIGPILLFFTPRFFGDLPSNVKDPVFAIYYLLALLVVILIPKISKRWFKILALGVSFGLAAAYRTIGYSLIPLYLIITILDIWPLNRSKLRQFLSMLLDLILIIGLMVLIHGIEMPFVLANPLQNLPRLMAIARAFPWQGTMLYLGNSIEAGNLPWHYLPVWLLVITPLFILVFGFISHLFIRQSRSLKVLAISFWLNIFLYYLIKPIIYDGIRHFLFILVILTCMAGIGWLILWNRAKKVQKLILACCLSLSCLSLGIQYLILHPYEYTYFNAIAGFLPGASRRFETDYWGTSYYEGARWLINHLNNNRTQTIGLCGNEYAAIYFDQKKIKSLFIPHCDQVESSGANYVLVNGRNDEWHKVNGNLIYTVTRMGVPLMKIFAIP